MTRLIAKHAFAATIALAAFLSSSYASLAMAQTPAATQGGGIFVIGASGDAGSNFIRSLPADVGPITAFLRPTSNLRLLGGRDMRFAVGDVLDSASVERAIIAAKPSIIFVSVNGIGAKVSPYVPAAEAVVKSARAVGAKQIIWISQAGASKDGVVRGLKDINYDAFEKILVAIGKGEKILADSGLPLTIIRVGAIIIEGPGRGGVHPATGKGYLVEDQTVVGPIAYGDLGRLAASCAGNSKCIGKTFHATDDTLGEEFKYWRCNRFTASRDWDKVCPTSMTDMVDGQFR